MRIRNRINERGQLVSVAPDGHVFQGIRERIVREAKDKPCADCGRVFHHSVMEFDHLPRFRKLFNIAQYSHHSRKEIRAEIAKCEVVCSNCHRVRTWGRTHA